MNHLAHFGILPNKKKNGALHFGLIDCYRKMLPIGLLQKLNKNCLITITILQN